MSQLVDQRDIRRSMQHHPPIEVAFAQFGIDSRSLAQFGSAAGLIAQFGSVWRSLAQLPALSSDHSTRNEVEGMWRDRPRCDAH